MGFTYNDTASADMGLKARLTSWQVCGGLRNYTASIPGKSGVADFGADFDYREINVSCSIAPKRNFTSLVSLLDDISLWLDPTDGLKQLVFDDVPDRYFMARLHEKVDCERLLVRSAGSFDLKFFCPDPFAYAVEDEEFTISSTGSHTVRRTKGNIDSHPVYRIKGVITSGVSNYITITTNGSQLKIVNATLTTSETLVVDTDMMTAWVEDANGNVLRNGLPYLSELNFPTLSVGGNTIAVAANNATFTSLEIQAKSRWR